VPAVDTLPTVAVPTTDRDVSEPTEVTFGCDAVVKVPVNSVAARVLLTLSKVKSALEPNAPALLN